MKYAVIAGLAAVAVASPQWEAAPVAATTSATVWENVEPTTSSAWESYEPPKPTDVSEEQWEEWNHKPEWTTTVVTAITTYCPKPTEFVHQGKTWSVTEPTTITITECPCTISVPVYTKTSTSCGPSPTAEWAYWPNGCKDGKDEWGNDCEMVAASTWAAYPLPAHTDSASSWMNVPLAATSASTWANVPLAATSASTWANVPLAASSSAATTWEAVPIAATTASSSSSWAGWSATTPAVATWTGAANKINVGAGLAGVAGIAALLL